MVTMVVGILMTSPLLVYKKKFKKREENQTRTSDEVGVLACKHHTGPLHVAKFFVSEREAACLFESSSSKIGGLRKVSW